MTAETPEPVDVRNNPESRAAERDATTSVARASDGGAPPRDAPDAGELPVRETGGTADGNPVSGVTISAADEEEAVSGDTGPLELGQQESSGS
ncbi:MAG: hypothetical protein ABWY56_17735 [Propionibacteriaceae bacterium]